MKRATDQILAVAQMRAAEEELIERGTSVDALMQIAGQGAAEWVYRLAWPRPVTVLCGPGNNGGDGYVIAESLRKRHLPVVVVAPLDPVTEAARHARAAYEGEIWAADEPPQGAVLVDCLFGSGLTRPLGEDLLHLLQKLSRSHVKRVAVDLPSGVESDSGQPLNEGLPQYDLTIGLGAWKFAHWTMPAAAMMGERHLVPIGVEGVRGAARLLERPTLAAPAANAHKYTRGLVAVVAGDHAGRFGACLQRGDARRGGLCEAGRRRCATNSACRSGGGSRGACRHTNFRIAYRSGAGAKRSVGSKACGCACP